MGAGDITTEEKYMKFLGKFNAQIKITEDAYRKRFVEREPQEYASEAGNELMIDVFAQRDTFKEENMLSYEGYEGDLIMGSNTMSKTPQYTIVERETFQETFNRRCNNAFEGIDWSNIVVAGGAVLGALSVCSESEYHNSDIDVFIYGLSPEEATKKIFSVLGQINKNVSGSGHVLVSQHSVTLLGLYPMRHVQFVLRLYR